MNDLSHLHRMLALARDQGESPAVLRYQRSIQYVLKSILMVLEPCSTAAGRDSCTITGTKFHQDALEYILIVLEPGKNERLSLPTMERDLMVV